MNTPMESLRLISLVVFCVSVFLLGEKWIQQYGPRPAPAPARSAPAADTPVPSSSTVPAARAPAAPATAPAVAAGQILTLESDVLRLQVSTAGGDIRHAELLSHRDTLDRSRNFVLLESGRRTYLAQSGLLGAGLPNHRTLYTAANTSARLEPGADEVRLELSHRDAATGLEVVRTYRARRGEYVVRLSYEVRGLAANTKPSGYFQLVRDDSAPEGDSRWVPTYNGVAVFTARDKYQKVNFSDIAKGKASHARDGTDGWIAMVQHYFVSAWLPAEGTKREFFTRALDNGLYAAGVVVPATAGSETGRWSLEIPLYVGPQQQDRLASLAPGLEYTVDYGWLTVIATPLFWTLSFIHGSVASNWGVAIILLTVLLKLIFFPLSAASYKSMARMRVLGPRLQKLKEQFGDDRQKMQQAMMELYRTEKINPLGGCLPIVVQIPVFIALYWVLLGSVEMRQAPFALWIDDLSSPDRFYVLPVLMGISMIVQSRLNPEPPDPIQAKVMKIMPIAFSVFFFFFPAGLVLYWLVNNVLSIAQQWYITRQLEKAGLAERKR